MCKKFTKKKAFYFNLAALPSLYYNAIYWGFTLITGDPLLEMILMEFLMNMIWVLFLIEFSIENWGYKEIDQNKDDKS